MSPFPPTRPDDEARHAWLNACQSGLLLVALTGLIGLAGWLAGGWFGIVIAAGGTLGLILALPAPERDLFDQMLGAMPLDPRQAPELHRMVEVLGTRAGLAQSPRLYLLPVAGLQALASGGRESSSLALTTGLLDLLTPRELSGVLAHEIAHLRHGDLRVMRFAATVSALTRNMSNLGIALLVLWLPMLITLGDAPSPIAFLLLLAAPPLGDLLNLSLSRRREFLADAGAVSLTGDPAGLAEALLHLKRLQGEDWDRRTRRARLPWLRWFRTHPSIDERVARLVAMVGRRPATAREENWPVGFLPETPELPLAGPEPSPTWHWRD